MAIAALGLMILAVPAAALGVAVIASLEKGYAWADMDWDGDGRTSVREFLQSADIGVRETQPGGRPCREYYALKDGLPVRLVCEQAGSIEED